MWSLMLFWGTIAHAGEMENVPSELDEQLLPRITLSVKEKLFLQKHNLIQIGTDHGWEPFAIKRADGRLEGFEIDLMRVFSIMSGAQFQIVTDRWALTQEKAKLKKIDGLADSTVNKAREPYFNFTKSYIQLYPVFVVRSDSSLTLRNINDLSGKAVSILQGNAFNLSLLKEYPDIEIVEAATENEAIKFVVEGKTDACLIAANTFNTHYKDFSNIIKIGFIETSRSLNLVYSIRQDWPEVVSIINKCLSVLPNEVYDALFYKWFNMDRVSKVKTSGKITTTIADNFYPYSFVNKRGEPDGYIVDLVRAIAKEIDVEVEIRQEVLENSMIKLLKGQINTMPMLVYSESREIQYDFSPAHTITYDALFTRKESPKILDLEGLKDKKIIVIKNDRAHEYLCDLPFIGKAQLIFEESPLNVLKKLAAGMGDAAVLPKISGITIINEFNLENIDRSPHIINDYNRLFCFAVKEGDSELLAKLENGLQLIKEKGVYKDIYDQWLGVYEPGNVTFKDVLKYFFWVIVSFILTCSVLVLWSLVLKQQVKKRTEKLEEEIIVRKSAEKNLADERDNLQKALEEIKTLKGLIPICSSCKSIRDDQGYWNQMEAYISQHSEAEFSHSICPNCISKLYPDMDFDKDV